jgi:hypothetical protein
MQQPQFPYQKHHNQVDPITFEFVNNIPPSLRIYLCVQEKLFCYNVIELNKWIKIRQIDPSTNVHYSKSQIKKINKRCNNKHLRRRTKLLQAVVDQDIIREAIIQDRIRTDADVENRNIRLMRIKSLFPGIWFFKIFVYLYMTSIGQWFARLMDCIILKYLKYSLNILIQDNPSLFQDLLWYLDDVRFLFYSTTCRDFAIFYVKFIREFVEHINL